MTEEIAQTTQTAPITTPPILPTFPPLARVLAFQLREPRVTFFAKVVLVLGEDKAKELTKKSLEIQAAGGMPRHNGTGNRTTGGIFFFLAREIIGSKEWPKIDRIRFAPRNNSNYQNNNSQMSPPRPGWNNPTNLNNSENRLPPGPAQPTIAEQLAEIYFEAPDWTPGTATSTKLFLVGRPGKVTLAGGQSKLDNFAYAAFTLETNKIPAIPDALPVPLTPIKYLVLVGSKQWRKTEVELKNENIRLLMEVYPSINIKVVAGIVATASSSIANQVMAKDGKEIVKPQNGITTTANLTLVGRPGEVKIFVNAVAFTMTAAKVAALPTGLPVIQAGTKYLVFLTMKQWKTVKGALDKSEDDKLILEAYPTFDPRFIGIIASVMTITTTNLQKAKREQQPAPAPA